SAGAYSADVMTVDYTTRKLTHAADVEVAGTLTQAGNAVATQSWVTSQGYTTSASIAVSNPISNTSGTIGLKYDNSTIKLNGSNQIKTDFSTISVSNPISNTSGTLGLKYDNTTITLNASNQIQVSNGNLVNWTSSLNTRKGTSSFVGYTGYAFYNKFGNRIDIYGRFQFTDISSYDSTADLLIDLPYTAATCPGSGEFILNCTAANVLANGQCLTLKVAGGGSVGRFVITSPYGTSDTHYDDGVYPIGK